MKIQNDETQSVSVCILVLKTVNANYNKMVIEEICKKDVVSSLKKLIKNDYNHKGDYMKTTK